MRILVPMYSLIFRSSLVAVQGRRRARMMKYTPQFDVKIKFEIKDVRRCVEGYFRKFIDNQEETQEIVRESNGIALQQHRFRPFKTVHVEVSSNADVKEIDIHSNDHQMQETSMSDHYQTFKASESLESDESIPDLFEDIASGQYNTHHIGKSLLSDERDGPYTLAPIYYVVVILIVCVMMRVFFVRR
eukprot:96418_1